MNKPNDNEKCGIEFCGHKFGLHWVSFDGSRTGCSYHFPGSGDQRDYTPAHNCGCKGFAIIYRYPPKVPSGQAAELWGHYDDIREVPS